MASKTMMTGLLQLVVGLPVVLCFVARSMSQISEVSGDILIIEPPESVSLGSLEDDFRIKLFVEQESVQLTEHLLADVSQAGTVASRADLSPIELFDVQVNSYFLHVDPVDNGMPPKEYEGSVVFSQEILGIVLDGQTLDPSDLVLGAPDTDYAPRDRFRGFEGPGFPARGSAINDRLELMPDLRTLSVQFMTTSRLDQVRIITQSQAAPSTAVVPEPTSSSLLIVGFFFAASFLDGPRSRRS